MVSMRLRNVLSFDFQLLLLLLLLLLLFLAGETIPVVRRSSQGLHTEGGAFACRFLIRVWVIVLSASNCAKMRRNLKLTETN